MRRCCAFEFHTHQLWTPATPPHKAMQAVPQLPGMAFMYTEHTQLHFSPTALEVFVQRLGSLPSTVVLITDHRSPPDRWRCRPCCPRSAC